MTDAALRAACADYIADATAGQLAALLDALEAALVARVGPHYGALMRVAVHGIRLTLESARRHDAAEAKEVR